MTLPVNTVIQGDCIEVMQSLPEGIVHCVVSSPPYFGLRDYRIPGRVWGGAPECKHTWVDREPRRNRWAGDVVNPDSKQKTNEGTLYDASGGQTCSKCGAWFGSHGLEPMLDCGGNIVELRDDLTDKEIEFVINELRKAGVDGI